MVIAPKRSRLRPSEGAIIIIFLIKSLRNVMMLKKTGGCTMTFCKACGKHLASGLKFCNGCGTPVAKGQEQEAVPNPVQQNQPSLLKMSPMKKRLVRSFAATLAALIIATMLLSWVTVRVEIDAGVTVEIVDNLDTIVTDWFDAHIELLDVEAILHEVREHEAVNERMGEFIDEIVETIRRDFGGHIELEADFGIADVITDLVIYDLVAEADEIVEDTLYEFIGDTMSEIRHIVDGVAGRSFSASFSVYSLAYLTGLVEEVNEVALAIAERGGLAELDMSFANLVTNILRAVWAVCILMLVAFLFLLSAEFKAAKLVGLIGAGFAFVLALVFAIGLFVGNSMIADTFGNFLQFSAAIWVYVCLGLSLTAIVLLAVYRKLI